MKKLLFLSGILLLAAQNVQAAQVEESRFDSIARQLAEVDEATALRSMPLWVNFGPRPYLSLRELDDLRAIASVLGKEHLAKWLTVETIAVRPGERR